MAFFNDSLPYLDDAYDSTEAIELLMQEMDQMKAPKASKLKNEFLQFKNDPILAKEFDRIGKGQSFEGPSMDRYKVEGPKGDNSDEDLEGWRRAVENAKAQLQHQRLRNVNAQLLKKYGSAAWNAYSYQLTGLIKILEVELVEAQQEVEGINKRRKISQTQGGKTIQMEENRRVELIEQILQIRLALQLVKTKLSNGHQ